MARIGGARRGGTRYWFNERGIIRVCSGERRPGKAGTICIRGEKMRHDCAGKRLRRAGAWLAPLIVGLALGAPAHGAPIPVANASFESPPTVFASPFVDSWTAVGLNINPDYGVDTDI